MIQNILIGIGVVYFFWSQWRFAKYERDHSNATFKDAKEYIAKMEIISKLLKDREQVRNLLLELGVVRWGKRETIDPGEIVVTKRELEVQQDSEIINALLKRRKKLMKNWTLSDLLLEMSGNAIDDYICRWPSYMEDKQ